MFAVPLLLLGAFVAPVEAPKPDARPIAIRIDVYQHGNGVVGRRIHTSMRTTGDGREAVFRVVTPAGWDETTTTEPGTRAEIRVVPSVAHDGAVLLGWQVMAWDRRSPRRPVRRSGYWCTHWAGLEEPCRGPDGIRLGAEFGPTTPTTLVDWFSEGARPLRIRGRVWRQPLPIEASKP